MDTINEVQLLAELENECCGLNHGPGVDSKKIPASDYLVVPVGYVEGNGQETTVRELVIPVCQECAQALQEDEWTLLYCLECNSSRWVCRQFAKNAYRHHVLWLCGCPDCTNKFGGLYFNDLPRFDQPAQLLVDHIPVTACS